MKVYISQQKQETMLNVYVLLFAAIVGFTCCAPLSSTTSGPEGNLELDPGHVEYSYILSTLTHIIAEDVFRALWDEFMSVEAQDMEVILHDTASTSGLTPIAAEIIPLAEQCQGYLTIMEELLTRVSEYIVWTNVTENTTLAQFQVSLQIYLVNMMPAGTTIPTVQVELPTHVGTWEKLQVLASLVVEYRVISNKVFDPLRTCVNNV